jgi:cytochrome c556
MEKGEKVNRFKYVSGEKPHLDGCIYVRIKDNNCPCHQLQDELPTARTGIMRLWEEIKTKGEKNMDIDPIEYDMAQLESAAALLHETLKKYNQNSEARQKKMKEIIKNLKELKKSLEKEEEAYSERR